MNRDRDAALIVISGLPRTGKSALAREVALHLGAVHLSIDAAEEALLAAGLTRDWTTGVAAYEVTGALAAFNLQLGRVVVVDAVNDTEVARSTWHREAKAEATPLHFVVTTCSDANEHRRRLSSRSRSFDNVREPTWDDVQRRAATFEPPVEPHILLDTIEPLSSLPPRALTALRVGEG